MNARSEVSICRLYLLRAMYVFIAVGLIVKKWPGIFNPPAVVSHMGTVVGSVLLAVSLLALLGIRYPLKMLPLLFFEFVWKSAWVLMWGLPLWSTNQLDPITQDTLIACLLGVVLVPIVMPWRYVFHQYVGTLGDPWRKQNLSKHSEQPSSSPSRSTGNFHL
jgi:hypothetical protein